MRGILVLLAIVASGSAYAEPERHLPRGEESPALIESLYSSPFGEVQFTRIGSTGGHSGFLRNNKGYLIGFREVHGPAFCETWFLSNKEEKVPAGCEFVFHDEETGREIAVRSGEMEEASLFQATKGKMRDLSKAMSVAGGKNVAF
jgi:hypothetical protein